MNMAKKKSEINPVPVNPPHELDAIAADGQSLLTPADEIPISIKPVVIDEKNPYQRAKVQLYAKWPIWKRVETDRMIANKEYDSRHYTQYCKDLNSLAEYIIYDDLEKEQKKTLTPVKK
jgi:hypothetical protein